LGSLTLISCKSAACTEWTSAGKSGLEQPGRGTGVATLLAGSRDPSLVSTKIEPGVAMQLANLANEGQTVHVGM
jgi:hypothetical protein